MDPLKAWLRLVKATYTRWNHSGWQTDYMIVPLENYSFHDSELVAGQPSNISRVNMAYLFDEYMISLNISLFYINSDKCLHEDSSFEDKNLCSLIDEIQGEGDAPSIVIDKVPDEMLQEVFYNALLTCNDIPHVAELLHHTTYAERDAVDVMLKDAERQYQEQLWKLLLPKVSAEALQEFVHSSVGYLLPENFTERMKLSPLMGLNYVQSQRHSTDQHFGSSK